MALIKCPECLQNVSDKANSCPHCGFPIQTYLNNKKYNDSASIEGNNIKPAFFEEKEGALAQKNVEEERLTTKEQEFEEEYNSIELPERPSKWPPILNFLFNGFMIIFSLIIAMSIEETFGQFVFILIAIGCGIWIMQSANKYYKRLENYNYSQANPDEYRRKETIKNLERRSLIQQKIRDIESESSRPVSCPKCGCTQISTINRGYSAMWGFIGSGKPVNVCQKCGYKWTPGNK